MDPLPDPSAMGAAQQMPAMSPQQQLPLGGPSPSFDSSSPNPLGIAPGSVQNPGIFSQMGQGLANTNLGHLVGMGQPGMGSDGQPISKGQSGVNALGNIFKGMSGKKSANAAQAGANQTQAAAVAQQFQAQNQQMQAMIKVLTNVLAQKGQSSNVLQNQTAASTAAQMPDTPPED